MDWADLLGGATSAMSGGIFGFIGSAVGGIFKYFQVRQQHKFEEKKWKHELVLLDKEHERDRQEDEHELSVISQQGAWSGLTTSIQADSVTGETYKWVNAIKTLYRPLLTTGLVAIAYLIFKDLLVMVDGNTTVLVPNNIFSPEQAKELIVYTVYSLVFSASTAVVWWFGDRAFAPPGLKNR
jgi:hypothetical protein